MGLASTTINGETVFYWLWEPNWDSEITVSYNFTTSISQNLRYNEQRRALMPNALRQIKAKFLQRGHDSQTIINDLRTVAQAYIIAPIYTEPMTSADDISGTITTMRQNLDDYWNLHNRGETVIAINRADRSFETNTIQLFSGSYTLVFNGAWSATYPHETTTIYPVMVGRIESKITPEALTDSVLSVSCNFKEVVFG